MIAIENLSNYKINMEDLMNLINNLLTSGQILLKIVLV